MMLVFVLNGFTLWQHNSMSLSTLIVLMVLVIILLILSPSIQTEITQHSISQVFLAKDRFKLATFTKIDFLDIQKIEYFNAPSRHRMLSITTLDGNRIDFRNNLDTLMDELSHHIHFDRTPNALYPYRENDIGQRPLYVILFSLILLLLIHVPFLFFEIPLYHLATHFSIWLLILIPICISLLYPWIKREQKGVPLFAACLSGLLLGFAITVATSATVQFVLG